MFPLKSMQIFRDHGEFFYVFCLQFDCWIRFREEASTGNRGGFIAAGYGASCFHYSCYALALFFVLSILCFYFWYVDAKGNVLKHHRSVSSYELKDGDKVYLAKSEFRFFRLYDWLIDWLFDVWIVGLIDWLIDWTDYWSINQSINRWTLCLTLNVLLFRSS